MVAKIDFTFPMLNIIFNSRISTDQNAEFIYRKTWLLEANIPHEPC